jgi:hypothetical protein
VKKVWYYSKIITSQFEWNIISISLSHYCVHPTFSIGNCSSGSIFVVVRSQDPLLLGIDPGCTLKKKKKKRKKKENTKMRQDTVPTILRWDLHITLCTLIDLCMWVLRIWNSYTYLNVDKSNVQQSLACWDNTVPDNTVRQRKEITQFHMVPCCSLSKFGESFQFFCAPIDARRDVCNQPIWLYISPVDWQSIWEQDWYRSKRQIMKIYRSHVRCETSSRLHFAWNKKPNY